MPNTKTTERKKQVVCPVCKDEIGLSEFSQHLKTCKSDVKFECSVCDMAYKKKAYLVRHVETVHSKPEDSKKNSPPQGNVGEESPQVSDESDWDSEPDVGLSVMGPDTLNLGRLVRKRTSPLPVSAPVKRKLDDERDGAAGLVAKVVAQRSPAKVSRTDKSDTSEFGVKFEVVRNGEKLRRSLNVTLKEEPILATNLVVDEVSTDLCKSEFRLSDFIGKNQNINPEDVRIRAVGGCLELKVLYK